MGRDPRTMTPWGGRGFPANPTLFVPSKLKLWIDPAGTKTTKTGAKFISSQSRYLAAASHADFDVSGTDDTQKFSVAFEKSLLSRPTNAVGNDRGYVGRFILASNSGWFISAGSGNNGQNSLRFMKGTGSALQVAGTTQATLQLPWSYCVMVYDASQDNDNTVKFYIDGSSTPLTNDGESMTITGAAMANAATSFQVGRRAGIGDYQSAAIRNVTFWKDVALTGANSTTLWNSGTPLEYAAMGALQTGVTASWLMGESSGSNRVSTVGSHDLVETGGAIDLATSVRSLVCAYPTDRTLVANYGVAPLYETDSSIGNALHFYGQHDMRAAAPAGISTVAGDWCFNMRADAFISSAMAPFQFYQIANAAGKNWIYPSMRTSATPLMHLRMWYDSTDPDNPNGSVESAKTDFAADTNYCLGFRGVNSAGDRYQLRWNGALTDDTISANMENGTWVAGVPGIDGMLLGGFLGDAGQDGAVQGCWDGWLGDIIAYGGSDNASLTDAQFRQLEIWTARRGGITIA